MEKKYRILNHLHLPRRRRGPPGDNSCGQNANSFTIFSTCVHFMLAVLLTSQTPLSLALQCVLSGVLSFLSQFVSVCASIGGAGPHLLCNMYLLKLPQNIPVVTQPRSSSGTCHALQYYSIRCKRVLVALTESSFLFIRAWLMITLLNGNC